MRMPALLLVCAIVCGCSRGPVTPSDVPTQLPSVSRGQAPGLPSVAVPIEPRSEMAVWPWPGMTVTHLGDGMSRSTARDARNGTSLVLLRFDLHAEPRLHFELYDADEDDATPDDDAVRDTSHLTARWTFGHLKDRGRILAVVNGPFFNFDKQYGHTAAVVRKRKVHANVGNPRWALVVKETGQGPSFSLIHAATRSQLQGFDWGAGNVQALVVNGKPTHLLPPSRTMPERKSPPSQADDCGPYPWIDYIKTARTSLGWRTSEFALLLVLQSPAENENTSNERRAQGKHQGSGWDLADLQRFWLAWGADGACNLDGGLATQLAWRDGDKVKYRSSNDPSDREDDGSEGTRSIPVLLFPYVVKR